MPITIKDIARARRRNAKEKTVTFEGFPYGLNSYLMPHQISEKEAAKVVNYKITDGGRLESRPAISRYTDTTTTDGAAIKFATKAPIGATDYELIVDENYKLYYLDSTAPTAIATLEGDATLMPFKGVVMIMDGSYLKYMDGVSGSSVKLCYDDGTGTDGFQFDNEAGSDDDTIDLNGIDRVAYKFTSQSWDTGYTIPPTTISAKLSKSGSPTGAIYAVVRSVATDATMAKGTLTNAGELTTGSLATIYSVTLTDDDITSEMSGGVAYYASVEHANGSGGAYVAVHCTTGSGLSGYQYTGAAWVASAGSSPIMSLQPGMPPKGSYGTIYKGRPFIAGDPDNPGYVWYGNLGYLDWSSSDGGGYVGLIDSDSNNFPVSAISVIYESFYAYGKETQPAIARLTGDSPLTYSLIEVSRRGWTTHKTLINTSNDLWTASRGGVDPLSGVQEYGDVRLFSSADPVRDRFVDYWDTDDTIGGYFPKDNQYWLSFPNYHRVLIARVNNPELYQNKARYPWFEYELYLDTFTSADYKWVVNGSEYYLQDVDGGDPGITSPNAVTYNGKVIIEGTAGSLGDLQWDYALDPTATYYTVYFKDASGAPSDTGIVLRSILKPTCYASYDGRMFVGGSGGYLYATDPNEYKDLGKHHIKPSGKTKYIEAGFGYLTLIQWQVDMRSNGGAGLNIKIFKDDALAAASSTWYMNLPISDLLTLADLDMDLGDADFSISSGNTPLWKYTNIIARSFQVSFEDAILTGFPLFVNGLKVLFRNMQR